MNPIVVFAQEAPSSVGNGVSLPIVLVLVAIAWIGTMKWGWKWSPFIAGMCVGTAGAASFAGDISRMLIGILEKLMAAAASSFH